MTALKLNISIKDLNLYIYELFWINWTQVFIEEFQFSSFNLQEILSETFYKCFKEVFSIKGLAASL